MTLQVEVRVRSVRYEEVLAGKHKGDLVKVHMLATEDVKILGVLTPQERLALIQAQAAEVEQEILDGEVVEEKETLQITGSKTEPPVVEPKWDYAETEGLTETKDITRDSVSAGF